MPLTDDEIQMLAALTARCRPHGATRWDPPGIAATIRKVANRSLPSVMRACAAAAENRENRTPAVIAQPGPHWRTGDDTRPYAPTPHAELCRDCGIRQGPGHPEDHLWVSLAAAPTPTAYGSAKALEARSLARAARQAREPELVAARRPITAAAETGVAKDPEAEAGSAT